MNNQKDGTSRRRANQLREAIKHAIYYKWLKEAGVPKVHVTKSKHQGATDAIIFEADARIKFHLKDSLFGAPKEKEGYNILKEQWKEHKSHIVPPLFEDVKGLDAIMLVPYQNAVTLHTLIANRNAADDWIKELYKDFLKTSKNLWISSKLPHPCNLEQIYKRRIIERNALLKEELNRDQINNLEVIINRKSYGTLGEWMNKFSAHLAKLRVNHSCTIHGDEHANNIMIYNDAINLDPTGWVLIDYVNVRKNSDWIFSVAKMLQWWQFYYVLELAKSKDTVKKQLHSMYKIRGEKLELNYTEDTLNKYSPSICKELEKEVMEFANEVGADFQESQADWQKRLKLALFSVIFGSMPLHFKEVDFAIPVMIHKSLQSLDNL